MNKPSECTLAVLAGGVGARMGRPKGTLMIGGAPVLGRLLDRLAWTGPTLLVTAPGREGPPAWDRFDREVTDPVAGEGPLRGVLTALDATTTPVVVVTTVDMPAVTAEQLSWLIDQLGEDDLGVMLQHDAEGAPQLEPFPMVIRVAASEVARVRLAAARRSVHGLAGEAGFVVRAAPPQWPAETWTNLNTPDDLARYGRGS